MTAIFDASKELADIISSHLHYAVASEMNVSMSDDLKSRFFSFDKAAAEEKAQALEGVISSTVPETLSDFLALALIARSKVDTCEDKGPAAMTSTDVETLAGCLDGLISSLIQVARPEESPLVTHYGRRWILRRSQSQGTPGS